MLSLNRLFWLIAVPAVLVEAPALAQESDPAAYDQSGFQTPATPAPEPVASAEAPSPDGAPLADNEVGFSSDTLEYDDKADIVTARGEVRMVRQGNHLRADTVIWNRMTGKVRAEGNVVVTNPNGDKAYADSTELTDTLKDGVAENMLLVLKDGGRLSARHGSRLNGVSTLTDAAYTPCSVTCNDGRPKQPLWKITAVRVVDNPNTHRISYRDARFYIFNMPILWLPTFSHPDGSDVAGESGLLVPNVQYSGTLGLSLAQPYYWQIGANQDLLVTPHLYSAVLPLLDTRYRLLGSNYAFQVRGIGTVSTQQDTDSATPTRSFRGYIDANGTWQPDPYWTVSGSIRRVTDKTFLTRYEFSSDDRLRSTINAERIDDKSYLSIAGWAFEGLRATDSQGQSPIVLPAVDYRRRIDNVLAGKVELEANSLSILRTEGQDTQRAFASARWDLRRITGWGQELTLTAYGRGDLYHTDNVDSTATVIYRGLPGWEGRAIGALAADLRWPFVGPAFGGTQRIAPRVQVVASPPTKNLAIPNEDARAIDLEDSNLFALNRFPGYDRWEDGTRITYGVEYALDLPRFSLQSLVGQSYRFSSSPTILPAGTGLSSQLSDIVGRVSVSYGSFLRLTERFRIDKSSFAVRRNEIDATIGSKKTYVELGYLKLNRDISTSIEDLRDTEELRAGGRVQILEHWSLFGSTIIDLTGPGEDPTITSSGFEPVRHRLGVQYDDSCVSIGFTWRRDYVELGDAKAGNSFLLRVAFKNLGR